MWPVKNSVQAVFGVAILIAAFGNCHCQLVGGYAEVGGGNSGVGGRRCPQGALYFPPRGHCYPVPQENGPCGDLMSLVPSAENPSIGVCECKKPAVMGNNYPDRPLVFVEQNSRCYPIYHQGPCQNGDWLVAAGRGNVGVCERIPCPKRYYAEHSSAPGCLPIGNITFVFAIHGICFTTGNPCSTDDPEKTIFFNGLSLNPTCDVEMPSPGVPAASSLGVIGDNGCEAGLVPDEFGKCFFPDTVF